MNKSAKKGGGILGGLLLLVVGIGILWSNEGRTVKTQSAILEAKKSFIQVKSDTIDSKNDGKLVATKGKINIDEATELKDDTFGINVKAVKMKRTVEMYQWQETCTTDDNDKTTCTYEKVWESKLLDSSDYKESGHTNPTDMPYESEVYIADNVKLGAFTLPEELIKSLNFDKKKTSDQITAEYNNSKEDIKVDGKFLTNVKSDGPVVGDIRISYEYTTAKNASVLAVQTDDTFEAFTSKKGKDIYTIVEGNKTGTQILENMASVNKTIKWGLRLLGSILVIGAFSSMLSFITNIAGKVPVLGAIIGGATGLVSGILGISVSLLVIAIAWFRFRPVLSIVLIIAVIALIIFLKIFAPKLKKEETK